MSQFFNALQSHWSSRHGDSSGKKISKWKHIMGVHKKRKKKAHVKIKPNLTDSWRPSAFYFKVKQTGWYFAICLDIQNLPKSFFIGWKLPLLSFKRNHSSSSARSVPWRAVVDPLPARCSCCSGHTVHLAAGSRALIEQILGSAGAQGQSVLFEGKCPVGSCCGKRPVTRRGQTFHPPCILTMWTRWCWV